MIQSIIGVIDRGVGGRCSVVGVGIVRIVRAVRLRAVILIHCALVERGARPRWRVRMLLLLLLVVVIIAVIWRSAVRLSPIIWTTKHLVWQCYIVNAR